MLKKFIKRIVFKILDTLYPIAEEVHAHNNTHFISSLNIGPYYSFGDNVHVYGEHYITIGNNFRAGDYLRLDAIDCFNGQHYSPRIIIGDNVCMQSFCHIGCVCSIIIGSGTLIAGHVLIIDHNHGTFTAIESVVNPEKRPLSYKPIIIGENNWIGEGACILPGVELGNNVVVGANSVVTKSFPSNCIVAGVPAKIIRYL